MRILVLLFMTIVIELMTAAGFKRLLFTSSLSNRDYMTAVIAANLVSFPVVWVVFEILSKNYHYPPMKAFVFAELLVILIEAVLLRLQLSSRQSSCAALSACMNMTSAALGAWIWKNFSVLYWYLAC